MFEEIFVLCLVILAGLYMFKHIFEDLSAKEKSPCTQGCSGCKMHSSALGENLSCHQEKK